MLDALHDSWLWLHVRHLGLLLTLGWLGYLVWLGGWIVLQKRAPAATLSWLLGLAALPYVGFLIYYVFGPSVSACAAPAHTSRCPLPRARS